jgi:heterodisulfide reductase subunit B
LETTSREYDRSTRAVCKALGIELCDIPDWVCCGSTPAHVSNVSLSVALPVLNLQKAREMEAPVLTACASCYSRLRTANHKIRNVEGERERTERITGVSYDGRVEVHHLLDVLFNHLGVDAIREQVKKPLRGLRVACYYGCLLTRPPEVVAFDDPEHPVGMEAIVAAIGARPIDWPYRTECCGASLSLTHSDVSCRLGHKLLSMARECGAECLAVACPLCQVNLDLRQRDAIAAYGELPETPVPYITQLLGLALDLPADRLGLSALSIDPEPLLREHASLVEGGAV